MKRSVTQYDDGAMHALRMRFAGIGLVLSVGFVVIVFRAVQLQMEQHPNLRGVAQQQYHAVIPVVRKRGKILDARERELAVNVPVQSIFADPTSIIDPVSTLDQITKITTLGASRAVVERRLRGDKQFAWIVRRVPNTVAEQVKALDLPGIHFLEETRRVYPNGTLASQLLGAVGYDAEALAGLEMTLDRYLAHPNQDMVYQRDARGRFFFTPLRGKTASDSMAGNAVLTIDKIIQYAAEKSLVRAVEDAQAKSGVAVVVEVHTGRVLAMASVPHFDPNNYSKYPQEAWRNRAVTDVYEPGSTLKAMLVASALDQGMSAQQRFDCEQGKYRVQRAVLKDTKPHGVLSVADIVQVSSNIGSVKIAETIGRDVMAQAYQGFGFGVKTGIDFPGESAGMMRDASSWRPVEMATMAFGQGLTTSPLQITMAFAALANGGRLMRPYLLDKIVDDEGQIIHATEPQFVRQVVEPASAEAMRSILRRVVEEGGTGIQAASGMYRIAGKTGTAQKVVAGERGYSKDKYFSSFAGFAPAHAPEIAVFVGLDEPVGSYYGGSVAGPVVREIVESALQYLEVPTTDAPVILASTPQAPRTDAAPPASTSRAAFHVQPGGAVVVPQLTGLSMRQVLRMARESNVPLSVSGLGVAATQNPRAGERLVAGRAVEVEFTLPE